MLRRPKMDPHKNVFSQFFLAVFVLAISVDKVRSEEWTYGTQTASRGDSCALNNVLQSFLTPDDMGSMQMDALRQGLWRILTSPALNENLVLPNYDLLSDGRLLYDLPSHESKRAQSVFSRMITASPYFRKYQATATPPRVNAIHALPSSMVKKSIATLAKNGQLPTLQSPEEQRSEDQEEKRNVESLARLGGIHQGLESLARSGYFSGRQNDDYDEYPSGKRNVGSLARNGELHNKHNADNYISYYKRNIQNLMKTGGPAGPQGKSNHAYLIRNVDMPYYGDSEEHKRNIGTIARDWALPNHGTSWQRGGDDKRNVAALLRQDSYLHSVNRNSAIDAFPTPEADEVNDPDSKRNLPSIKAGTSIYGKRDVKRSVFGNAEPKPTVKKPTDAGPTSANRHKRQADEYFSEISNDFPLPELPKSDGYDYDELVKALAGDYLSNKKRFLGNIPLSRMTELGKISLLGQSAMSNATPTSPTYRRRQYLLSRTQPEENE